MQSSRDYEADKHHVAGNPEVDRHNSSSTCEKARRQYDCRRIPMGQPDAKEQMMQVIAVGCERILPRR